MEQAGELIAVLSSVMVALEQAQVEAPGLTETSRRSAPQSAQDKYGN